MGVITSRTVDSPAIGTGSNARGGMGVITSRTDDSPAIGTGSNARGFNILSWLKKIKPNQKGLKGRNLECSQSIQSRRV
ncbi:hypothetical protein TSAR_013997 [Trichomalopsis sarcophagae]|uniref:Uncharacterized protein n=1 Tax=Trichomalopsis sarcophagae TaxID=543379 RepID=A0A232FCR3_9HYME|nr:hypothetical protein TSAR_013997 [Trichomalopsis sarcophagae]